MRKNTKRSAVIAGVAAVAIGGGAAAWAFTGWNIGGNGSGEANASTITPLTAESSFKETLYPGIKTSMLTKVTNSNEFAVKLTGKIEIKPDGVTVTGGANDNDCKTKLLTTKDVLVTTFPGNPTVPAKTANQDITSEVKIGDLPQSCAGANIKVSYTFTSASLAEA